MVYKFLHSGHPSYFCPHLSICWGRYGTRYNRPDKRFLEVPQYYSSVHKSKEHFSHSFAFDAPTLWNDLPDDVCSAPNFACFKKKLKSYLFEHVNFPVFPWCLPGYVYGIMIIDHIPGVAPESLSWQRLSTIQI